jgi:hypothetical protein
MLSVEVEFEQNNWKSRKCNEKWRNFITHLSFAFKTFEFELNPDTYVCT